VNKRIFPGESYGHSSTETTRTKTVQAEAHIQSLQNTLVETLIGEISKVQNRRMYMEYRPYIQTFVQLIEEISPTPSVAVWMETMEKLTIVLLPNLTAFLRLLKIKNRIRTAK
jgi:hypothetical protein